MFNQDSLDKGHSKRVARAVGSSSSGGGGGGSGGSSDPSEKSNSSGTRASSVASGSSALVLGSQPSRAAVERMVAELDEREKLKNNFSRRREVFDEEHTTHINESNRTFNKKLARAYDKHTVELRQALERGTA